MSARGLGRVKTKSDLVVMPSGGRIFAFFCSERDHTPQNFGCNHTAQRFHTARVKSVGWTRRTSSRHVRCASDSDRIVTRGSSSLGACNNVLGLLVEQFCSGPTWVSARIQAD